MFVQAWVQCETCGYREQERPSGWYPLQHHTSWPSLQFSLRTDTRSTEDGTHTKPLFQCAAYLFPTKGNRKYGLTFVLKLAFLLYLAWHELAAWWSEITLSSRANLEKGAQRRLFLCLQDSIWIRTLHCCLQVRDWRGPDMPIVQKKRIFIESLIG